HRLAPPSGARGDSRCQESLQWGEVTSLGCGHERIEKAPSNARTDGRAPAVGDTLASARCKLPSVCFFQSEDVRDLAICVVERLAKNVHGSFRGREALLQHLKRGPQRFAPFRSRSGVGAGVHWFPNPARSEEHTSELQSHSDLVCRL